MRRFNHVLRSSSVKASREEQHEETCCGCGDPHQINDSARVFPGDGVAPLTPMIQTLVGNGFEGVFSLELFNPEYWKRDAFEVAKEGLDKMKASVQKALS